MRPAIRWRHRHPRSDFVDKQDDVWRLLELVHHRFHALFKLTTVFVPATSEATSKVTMCLLNNTRLTFFSTMRKASLSDRRFPDARLSHQDGVVLFGDSKSG